ncbi:MAG: hypothetical protein VKL39_08025 [Leptolyngbyaceae bacterium]|nr:hypothetical protein [Leptolyngbyaceae bacterium]
MTRGDAVTVVSGWLSGQRGYVERVDGDRALVMVPGGAFPFPRLERIELAHLRRVDVERERRERVGEALF